MCSSHLGEWGDTIHLSDFPTLPTERRDSDTAWHTLPGVAASERAPSAVPSAAMPRPRPSPAAPAPASYRARRSAPRNSGEVARARRLRGHDGDTSGEAPRAPRPALRSAAQRRELS